MSQHTHSEAPDRDSQPRRRLDDLAAGDCDSGSPRFLACRDCLAAAPLRSPFDAHLADEEGELPFSVVHAGHRVETLTRCGDAYAADRPVWDPLACNLVEVSNGCEIFVLRATRESLDEPRRRTLIQGRLRLQEVHACFDSALLRRALDTHFYPHALRPSRIDRLLSDMEDRLAELDPQSLHVLFDDADDPHVSLARIPDDLFADISSLCEKSFDGWELEHLMRFLSAERGDDGLLTVRVRRIFALETTAPALP